MESDPIRNIKTKLLIWLLHVALLRRYGEEQTPLENYISLHYAHSHPQVLLQQVREGEALLLSSPSKCSLEVTQG